MIITQKLGNLQSFNILNRGIDLVLLEWYETSKRIMNKRTTGGRELAMKFLQGDPGLGEGDILFYDDNCIVAVDILPCDVIVVRPSTMYQMACLCYEIGNKHLPLFIENETVMVPFDAPLFRMLTASGYGPVKASRKLLYPIKSTVSPHAHTTGKSLFSKIMELTNPSHDE